MNALRQFYLEIPVVTRVYTTVCCLCTLAVHLDLVSPLQLYFNPTLIVRKFQIWRLATTFLYFGTIGISFFLTWCSRTAIAACSRMDLFRGRSSDFVMMFIFGGVLMTFFGIFVNLLFLGQAFTLMLVYVWSRRNPLVPMNFFGVLNFQAPYLPWVLLCCSMILGNTVWVDIIGMGVGHIYYVLEDVYPQLSNGYRLIKTPYFLKRLFNEHIDQNYQAAPEERPGGFLWGGEGQPLLPNQQREEAGEQRQQPPQEELPAQ